MAAFLINYILRLRYHRTGRRPCVPSAIPTDPNVGISGSAVVCCALLVFPFHPKCSGNDREIAVDANIHVGRFDQLVSSFIPDRIGYILSLIHSGGCCAAHRLEVRGEIPFEPRLVSRKDRIVPVVLQIPDRSVVIQIIWHVRYSLPRTVPFFYDMNAA
jgi:hypothetical protein